MRTLALVLSALLCAPAWASPEGIANMNAQCECVMFGGVCRVENRRPLKPGNRWIVGGKSYSADAYNAIKAQGPLMCQAGVKACTADWNGEPCAVFRQMFRQEPVICDRQ